MEDAAGRLPAPNEAPEFPSEAGDPLKPVYELSRQLVVEAAAHVHPGRDDPRDYAPGVALLDYASPREALVGVVRWCAWANLVSVRERRGGWDVWRGGVRCLGRLSSRLIAAGAEMGEDEVEELWSYERLFRRRHCLFPCEVVRAVIEAHAKARGVAAERSPQSPERVFHEMTRHARLSGPPLGEWDREALLFDYWKLAPRDRKTVLSLARERLAELSSRNHTKWYIHNDFRDDLEFGEYEGLRLVIDDQLQEQHDWSISELEAWTQWIQGLGEQWYSDSMRKAVLKWIERTGTVSSTMAEWLGWAMQRELAEHKPDMRWVARVKKLLGVVSMVVLERGEAWSNQAVADLEGMGSAQRGSWMALLSHMQASSGSSPSIRWLKVAVQKLDEVGTSELWRVASRWIALVDKPREAEVHPYAEHERHLSYLIRDPHMDLLKGLCWLCSTLKDAEVARALGKLAVSCYRKVPGIGPRAVKVGNAAVWALGQMEGADALGQLAVLRVKVKFGSAQKGIEKALAAAAAREGLPREEIEELGVPSYGMTEVGRRVERFGEFEAEVDARDGEVELRWFKIVDGKRGKEVKSVPAAVKAGHAEELKELKAAVKDVGAMVGAQRERIDSLFLENKVWGASVWRERYLDHPVVGVVARRVIWSVEESGKQKGVTWLDDALVGVDGKREEVSDRARVRLWHPIEVSQEEVLAWRRFFEEREIRQPFKQAHREVYLLTDAERGTGTYSNRFAAHVIRQHQFNALAAARGWKNKLRLMVDDEYPPAMRWLPAWGLRAEFWVEGVGSEYGEDTNESGVFHHLATDQVRFYREDDAVARAHASGGGYGAAWGRGEAEEGMRLEDVPRLVFSEIMRDVDLFVGVGSVANNPQWQDGGPRGTHRDYWWDTSFGALGQTGAGRRDLLSRLLPRLKIAGVCELADKYLVVRGKLRTYKIHLGSGNILMEPNDQYLCIVPSGKSVASEVFLPFDGDRTLAIILSKAFMLAEDEAIKDSSIVSQIGRKT